MNKFAKRLKGLRQENFISQAELAEKINVGHSTIANWESGITQPNSTGIITLARYFEVSCDYLLGESDVP